MILPILKGLSKLDNKPVESNSDLNKLAAEVLKKYGIIPENISIVQCGSIKTVWKVKTQDRLLCLKRLKQSYDKALFSVKAQMYIRKSGGNVPEVIPDKTGQPIIQFRDQLFVAYEWLNGKDLNFINPADLSPALQGLARFHIASGGYEPVQDSRISTKLGKWPEQYISMRNRLLEWKETAKIKASHSKGDIPSSKGISVTQRVCPLTSCHSTYLKYVDSMVDLSDLALEFLEKSSYNNLTSPGSTVIVLCHQDFGKGNAILTGKGVFVLDLDGVTFDLPARDLRKIIGKCAENKGLWDANLINNVLESYTQVNPLTADEKEVLFIDLLYPHWFFGAVKNLYRNGKPLKSSEIEKTAKLEQSKMPLLKSLLKKGRGI